MADTTELAAPATRDRRSTAVYVLQVVIGLFFVGASALPKLLGESYAVEIFDRIGAGDWFRYAIGVVELAGGIGLLVPALAGLAASGLVLLMVGAGFTQLVVLDQPLFVITPVVLGALVAGIAWYRRASIVALLRR